MPRKKYTAEQIIGLLRQMEILLAEGKPAGQASRELGTSASKRTIASARSTAECRWNRPAG